MEGVNDIFSDVSTDARSPIAGVPISSSKALSPSALAATKNILGEIVCKIHVIAAKMGAMKTRVSSVDSTVSMLDLIDMKKTLSEIDVIRSIINQISVVYNFSNKGRECSASAEDRNFQDICIFAEVDKSVAEAESDSIGSVVSDIDLAAAKESLQELDNIRSIINQLSTACSFLVGLRKILTTLFTTENHRRILQSSLLNTNELKRTIWEFADIEHFG